MALANLAVLRQPQVCGPRSGLRGGMSGHGVGSGGPGSHSTGHCQAVLSWLQASQGRGYAMLSWSSFHGK